MKIENKHIVTIIIFFILLNPLLILIIYPDTKFRDVSAIYTPVIAALTGFIIYLALTESIKANKIIIYRPLFDEFSKMIDQQKQEWSQNVLLEKPGSEIKEHFGVLLSNGSYLYITDKFNRIARKIQRDRELENFLREKQFPLKLNNLDTVEKKIIKKYDELYFSIFWYQRDIELFKTNTIERIHNSDLLDQYKKMLYQQIDILLDDFFKFCTLLEKNPTLLNIRIVKYISPRQAADCNLFDKRILLLRNEIQKLTKSLY